MIISSSNVGMNSISSNMQTKTYEVTTTNLSNPSVSSIFKAEVVSLQRQNSSSRQVYNQDSKTNTVDYRNPAYKKNAKNSIRDNQENDGEDNGATADISNDARRIAKKNKEPVTKTGGINSDVKIPNLIFRDFRYSLLDSIVRLLTGGKSNLLKLNPILDFERDKFKELKKNLEETMAGRKLEQIAPSNEAPILIPAQSVQLGLQKVETKTTFYEEQSVHFQANGSVKTADGREIKLEVNLSMSSQFYSSNQTSIVQAMKDPLVMNLGPSPVELTQTKFNFDIDCDGKADQISFVAGNSGFLALDKNNDGTINDGSELFGARSGDGFAELSAYDGDGNGWIDEADDIFNKLRIWMKDEEGKDRLLSLGEAGIGAIYLGNVDTNYNLRGDTGDLNGQMRKTGIYLNENGTAGTIHHVDIAV